MEPKFQNSLKKKKSDVKEDRQNKNRQNPNEQMIRT